MDKLNSLFLVGVLLIGLPTLAHAQGETPEDFVRADVEARTVTLQGLETQLAALQQGADLEAQTQLAEDNRQAVEAAFNRYGVSSAVHTVYGTQESEAIAVWLQDHPEWQQQYDNLTARLTTLSGQIDVLRGGN
ncbi:MAG TPA: hypothetical protein P5330_09665 [Candidatus Competibacteraceae bacterium]|nr:hypothetical protein [Candidatus Competibacteraceae bacterium]